MKFLHRIVLFFLVFGMSLHASGFNYFISQSSSQYQFNKKINSYKKGDYSNLVDLQDSEIEIDNEEEHNLENSSFQIFYSSRCSSSLSQDSEFQTLKTHRNRYSKKLPLFIYFEDYRL